MAFTPCTSAGVTANIAIDCDKPRIKDYEQIGLLINRADIDWAESIIDASNPRIVNGLSLLATKKTAIIYNCKKTPLPFDGTQTVYNRDANAYDKTVQFYFEGIGGDASKSVVEPLKDADYVLILERKSKYGAGSFQVFGWQKGLSAGNEGGAQVQDEATGYWLMTMTTQEPFAEIELGGGGYVNNKTNFDDLVAKAY